MGDPEPGIKTGEDGALRAGFTSKLLRLSGILVSIDEEGNRPTGFVLHQNYPNPFNPSTNIGYRIADGAFVTLKVYDVLGNEVATLVNEEKQPGVYEVEFNTSSIKHLPSSGVNFYQVRAGDYLETKKMVLIK